VGRYLEYGKGGFGFSRSKHEDATRCLDRRSIATQSLLTLPNGHDPSLVTPGFVEKEGLPNCRRKGTHPSPERIDRFPCTLFGHLGLEHGDDHLVLLTAAYPNYRSRRVSALPEPAVLDRAKRNLQGRVENRRDRRHPRRRRTVGRARLASPRAHRGFRETLRVDMAARDTAVQSGAAAVNELKALVVTTGDPLRSELGGLRTAGLAKRRSGFR
jgi:hypothetical protein